MLFVSLFFVIITCTHLTVFNDQLLKRFCSIKFGNNRSYGKKGILLTLFNENFSHECDLTIKIHEPL